MTQNTSNDENVRLKEEEKRKDDEDALVALLVLYGFGYI